MRILWLRLLSITLITCHLQPTALAEGYVKVAKNSGKSRVDRSEKEATLQDPPPRGTNLESAGKYTFFGGLAGLGLAALLVRTGNGDDGVHPNPLALLGVLGGITALAVSPFLYFPGVYREEKYRLWKEGKLEVEKSATEGESARNRQGKWFGLHMNVFGSEGGLGNSIGLIATKFLGYDRLMEFNLATSQGTEFPGNIEKHVIYRYYAARFTRFIGNSFYLTGGIAYRYFHGQVAKQSERIESGGYDSRVLFYETKKQDIGFDAALGNRWQWQTYSMGFDWFGLYVPAINLADMRKRDPNPENSDGDKADDAVKEMDLTRKVGVQGLRFHLGVTF